MSVLSEDIVRNLIANSSVPLVFRGYVRNWSLCQWDVEKWCSVFGEKEIPFRCLKKDFLSDEPCWERRCSVKRMSFKNFVDTSASSDEWMYFDYKYLYQWFNGDDELYKGVSWQQFGYSDKGASDATLWVGSSGAHTPAHQDTYGVNIVTQLYGKKRWILFPPETGGLKPTRVPYEESSVYSELNFYCPNSLEVFNGLIGARSVELSAGDALLVPRGWWHYVQNLDPLNIALNMWLPHEKDGSTRVSEALIKIFVAQICKDLPQETAKLIVNPNEDDIADTPLSVLFLQLETVANAYLDNRRKLRRAKRQRTCEDEPTPAAIEDYDFKTLLENKANNLEIPSSISSEELIKIIKQNLLEYANRDRPLCDDEIDGSTTALCLTKAVIDSYSQANVIDLVKQNLFARLS
ncbi:HSPB1-associated protein 1 homolog [Spodoptera litura]|uniref:HSPB1-associated protein 1 homolog n=1 Tax=Spodoptera litura TaxID=69820 RepID=A0A9J7IM83_SPOLT|nr:HSPB1-associated protein 1 homolog [Spodoptera litura]